MAKIEWVFQDESGTNLNRYIATNVNTGEKITFDLLRGGNVRIVGTPLNASNLNSLITAINNNYDEIATLKTSVSTNSSKITLLETDNTNNKNTISALGKGLTNAESRISTNATNIQTNAGDISQLKTNVSSNKNTISKQGVAINTNTTNISNVSAKVTELEEEIQVANDSINANTDEINNLKENINTTSKTFFEVTLTVANLGDTNGTLQYDKSTSSIISSMGSNPQNYEIKFKYVISGGITLTYYLSYSDFINAGGYSQYVYSNGYHKIGIIPSMKVCSYSVYQAKYATYASTDTSKGTIEERLNALGFNEGVANYTFYASATDGSVSSNSLKKQGKYVLFNFVGTKISSVIIPEKFRPKENTTVSVYGIDNLHLDDIFTAIINTDGTISFYTKTYGKVINLNSIGLLNVGWETA